MKHKYFLFFTFVLLWFEKSVCFKSDYFEIAVSPLSKLKTSFEARFPLEEHKVTTKDGYILTLHRILSTRRTYNKLDKQKYPIYMHHALCLDSSAWMWGISNNVVLPFYLSDAGYDIWLGNTRGNYHSSNHTNLNYKTSRKFWDFSWHEIGIYDLPAAIDYVLNVTNSEKLHYVGHSQGTAAFYVLTTELPNYNNKILSSHTLTPTVYMENLPTLFIDTLKNLFGVPNDDVSEWSKRPGPIKLNILSVLLGGTCRLARAARICTNLYGQFFGLHELRGPKSHINEETAATIFENTPQGASLKSIVHYSQIVNSRLFRKFDYGRDGNMRVYNKTEPPEYDLKKTTCPVFLYYSKYDALNSYLGNIKLASELNKTGALRLNFSVPSKYKFNHLDFIYGKIAKKLIFEKILDGVKKIENEIR